MTRTLAFAVAILAAGTPATAQPLDPVTRRITQAWERGDVNAIGSFAARNGLSLDTGGQKVGPLQARQAAMALKSVFERVETVSVDSGRAREVEGNPRRAFVEITWVTKARGTSIPERTKVFFGLIIDGDSWRITEIRLIQ